MTMLPFKLAVEAVTTQFLFTVRGELTAKDIEGGRIAHNQAAGSDQGVAAARSFGDLSHAVFVPMEAETGDGAGELLIIDYWNSATGHAMFFADPQVKKGGALLFKQRDAVLWQSTPGLPRVTLPAPIGRNERYVGVVRGTVASRTEAERVLTDTARQQLNDARALGLMSREFYFRYAGPGEPPSLEVIGVDVWFDRDGMDKHYADPDEMKPYETMFTAMPDTSVWMKPKGQWVEW